MFEEAITKSVCECGESRAVEGTGENGIGLLVFGAYCCFVGAEELSVSCNWSMVRGGGKDGWCD